MSDDLTSHLLAKFPFLTERPGSVDCPALDAPADKALEVLQHLRDHDGYRMLIDITAIDDGLEASPRFTVVYHLLNLENHTYVRVAAAVENDLEPEFPSTTGLWPAADWHERECYDMFGIKFTGHPDLRRILMWDGYEYFPLRKDFPLAGHETDLPDEVVAEESGVGVISAPMMGGPFVAPQRAHMSDKEPRAKDESWTEQRNKPASNGNSDEN